MAKEVVSKLRSKLVSDLVAELEQKTGDRIANEVLALRAGIVDELKQYIDDSLAVVLLDDGDTEPVREPK